MGNARKPPSSSTVTLALRDPGVMWHLPHNASYSDFNVVVVFSLIVSSVIWAWGATAAAQIGSNSGSHPPVPFPPKTAKDFAVLLNWVETLQPDLREDFFENVAPSLRDGDVDQLDAKLRFFDAVWQEFWGDGLEAYIAAANDPDMPPLYAATAAYRAAQLVKSVEKVTSPVTAERICEIARGGTLLVLRNSSWGIMSADELRSSDEVAPSDFPPFPAETDSEFCDLLNWMMKATPQARVSFLDWANRQVSKGLAVADASSQLGLLDALESDVTTLAWYQQTIGEETVARSIVEASYSFDPRKPEFAAQGNRAIAERYLVRLDADAEHRYEALAASTEHLPNYRATAAYRAAQRESPSGEVRSPQVLGSVRWLGKGDTLWVLHDGTTWQSQPVDEVTKQVFLRRHGTELTYRINSWLFGLVPGRGQSKILAFMIAFAIVFRIVLFPCVMGFISRLRDVFAPDGLVPYVARGQPSGFSRARDWLRKHIRWVLYATFVVFVDIVSVVLLYEFVTTCPFLHDLHPQRDLAEPSPALSGGLTPAYVIGTLFCLACSVGVVVWCIRRFSVGHRSLSRMGNTFAAASFVWAWFSLVAVVLMVVVAGVGPAALKAGPFQFTHQVTGLAVLLGYLVWSLVRKPSNAPSPSSVNTTP